MSKELKQSQKLVSKAVGVFATAVADVEKANEILIEGIKSDTAQIMKLEHEIALKQEQITALEKAKAEKGEEIRQNENLLATLKQFTPEG